MPVPDRERGAALLTVLLLVAVIAVLAGGALERLRLTTRLTGNAAAVQQARAYAYAAEVVATTRVAQLMRATASKVTLQGDWSGRAFGLPVPGGSASARVTDGGNCFNLNSLGIRTIPGIYASNGGQRAQFARLMRLVGVPAQVAEQIAAGAADWIDTDQDQQSFGAEDASYLAQGTPYRTAGTLMADASELRAIAGMTPDLYARIRPWVCVLPGTAPATLNVNTITPEQAPLIAMLQPDTLSVEAARQLLLKRPAQGFDSAATFWGSTAAPSGNPAGTVSRWFDLVVEVDLGSTHLQEHALIDASRLPVRLVARQWGDAT